MTERNGFERVRDFVVTQCRQAPGGVARITTAEIGQAAGISRQTAHDHLQTLIDIGILAVVRRSVYSLNIVQNIPARALQPDVDLTETLQRPDKNLTNRQVDAAFLPPEPDVDLTETLQGPDKLPQ